uniref:CSON003421 protein n=1 Tax=Culicoides sonorensis TaxID=179676 RepID=A0A336L3U0_CULSO
MSKKTEKAFYQELFEKFVPNLVIESIEKTQGTEKGDNYTSVLDSVTLKGIVKNGNTITEWKRAVFCKRLPESVARRETYKSIGLFHNEIAFYKNIYPEFKKYQQEFNVEPGKTFIALPKCYYAEDNILVLADLRDDGFKMQNRIRGLSIDELKGVFSELAKFHGLSLAMKYNQPERFKKLRDQISEGIFRPEYKEWYKTYYGKLTKNAVQMVSEGIPDQPKYIEKIQDFTKNFFDDFTSFISKETPLSVLCHGDCWTNNILFSYKSPTEIKQTCFIDFQLMRYGSLTLDVVYALYLSLPSTLRKTHKSEVIRFYYENLVAQLKMYGPIPRELVSEENLWTLLQQDLQSFSKFSLYTGMDMIPILTCQGEDAPDCYEAEEENEVTEAPELGIPINSLCQQKMIELVVELTDAGLL